MMTKGAGVLFRVDSDHTSSCDFHWKGKLEPSPGLRHLAYISRPSGIKRFELEKHVEIGCQWDRRDVCAGWPE